MSGPAESDADRDVVTRLLGRAPAGAFTVVVRRTDGTPSVIENHPLLDDGRPMPTRYWLVDQALRDDVSRLEAAGGVRRAARDVPADAVAVSHARYAAERDAAMPPGHTGPAPAGGVGGTRRGVKCLHAHLAWYLTGGDDPVGRWTAENLAVDPAAFVITSERGDRERVDRVAAVDCGTNSTRLIVVDEGGTVLSREIRITRLGQGVDATHRLSRQAIDRTLSALRVYRGVMDEYGVARRKVVATSAVRDAVNAEEFMDEATRIMGVRPEILSGIDEGRLSFLGATAHLPATVATSGPVLVADIGGGSTELAAGVPPSAGGEPSDVSAVSLDIGCVRVSERFLLNDPPDPGDLARARTAVTAEVAAARSTLSPLDGGRYLVGLAGTVSMVATLQQGLATYNRDALHHTVLEQADVERWLGILSGENADARLRRPGMVPGREDVIVGGVLILAVIMEVFVRDRCLFSEDDILDGLAATLISSELPSAE